LGVGVSVGSEIGSSVGLGVDSMNTGAGVGVTIESGIGSAVSSGVVGIVNIVSCNGIRLTEGFSCGRAGITLVVGLTILGETGISCVGEAVISCVAMPNSLDSGAFGSADGCGRLTSLGTDDGVAAVIGFIVRVGNDTCDSSSFS
jgi:hypothetical protein